MKKSNAPSPRTDDLELRETCAIDLELPDGKGFSSTQFSVAMSEVITFSESCLERFWSNPEFVRRRRAQQIDVPFEM